MNTKSKQTELINNKKIMPFNLSTKPDRTIHNLSTNKINSTSFKNISTLNIKKDVSQIINSTTTIKTNDLRTNKILNSKINKTNLIKSNKSLIPSSINKATTSTTDDYHCQLCELNFYTIERLDFHLIKIHKIDKRINLVQCYVNGCEDKFNKRMQLVEHLINIHNLEIKVYEKKINSLDEFFKWKDKLENDSGFKWIQNNKFYLNNRLRKTYICNRTATNGIKLYSLHGLTTINNHSTLCLSSIKITENDNGEFLIEFIETHNHDE